VKVRGFRIELGEVEVKLARHAAVQDVAVVVREDGRGDKQLVAYYTGERAPRPDELRQHAARELPGYMVPGAFVQLAALPLTANGKLDRKALPAPDAPSDRGYEAPVGEVETAIARIWAELLGVTRVGRHDDFFELGGHSLLAIRLIERMRRTGLYIDIRALFTCPTVAELVTRVAGAPALEVQVPPNLITSTAGGESEGDAEELRL
jgi:aryl carrier-like protein